MYTRGAGCFGSKKEGHAVDVSVIVEPISGDGYRAIGAAGLSLGLAAGGATAAEALSRLTHLIESRLHAGARLTELSVGAGAAPWTEDAGYLRESPLYQPWRDAIEDYRRQSDLDPEAL
jgi:hypothetical protein